MCFYCIAYVQHSIDLFNTRIGMRWPDFVVLSVLKSAFFKKEKKLSLCLTHSPPGNFAERCVWKLVERFSGWSLPGRTKTYHKAVFKSDASQPSDPSAVRGRIG